MIKLIKGKKKIDISVPVLRYIFTSALFSKADLDVVVLEVGLGGRLDATNIIDSDVSIITSIGIDHTEYSHMTKLTDAAIKSLSADFN